MKPDEARNAWIRLVAAARRAEDDRGAQAPYGFATRVAARAFSAKTGSGSLFDRFALRALGVACLLAIASVAINYSLLPGTSTPQDQVNNQDPMSVLLDS